ncbi:hypothetical protein PARPLA_02572 [Rhodobacteraceae bacterium THAF1]|uniref:DUF6691 family protein n=1 Tax=Palleronia sp. THAF1 TaxID=2587842 RepID=UPI000F40CC57|nr:DUF6691 family protein [Palleronia sp. THAF1]QFU08052.1 hypothetical protein FIU81_05135 [Palleronia sp. THAF1]VDC27907.1 hypothetical protein PARPLA_02572 [Rhodobacteraceae bacterium THAF1]
MRTFMGFLSGLVFGVGLLMSGMANPAKVLNFLDVFGTWDPSLAFVMGGASVVAFIGYRLVWQRATPLLDVRFELPTRTDIDPALLTGSAIFGIGWGIGGFCPGPAFTAIAFSAPGTFVFVAAMLAGILAGQRAKTGMSKAPTA